MPNKVLDEGEVLCWNCEEPILYPNESGLCDLCEEEEMEEEDDADES